MKILVKSSLSLFITILILGLLEVTAFWIYKDDIYQGDTAHFWKLKADLDVQIENQDHPFHLLTNSSGFRTPELTKNQEKWLFLGCSTTMGWGVEYDEIYTSLIQEAFPNIEIINAGQPGWSTHQMVMNLDEFRSWQPTRVFVAAGVRDSQSAIRGDSLSKPRSWLERRYLLRWLRERQPKDDSFKPAGFRVMPTEFKENLELIQGTFSSVPVVIILFPKLERPNVFQESIEEQEFYAPKLSRDLFFEDDSIHLNPMGHRVFANWFIERFQSNPEQ